MASNRYRRLSEEENKRDQVRNSYQNMPEEDKQKLKKCKKKRICSMSQELQQQKMKDGSFLHLLDDMKELMKGLQS